MKKYLASGMIKGIGPALAGRLVDAFDVQVFEVIEQTPQRLIEVDGIGKGRQTKARVYEIACRNLRRCTWISHNGERNAETSLDSWAAVSALPPQEP